MQTMIFGKHKFTLIDFEEIDGHDDSLPYNASIKMDDIVIAKGMNDGWGGDTQITVLNKELYDKAEKLLKKHKDEYGFTYSLSYLMDILAAKEADYLNVLKYVKQNQSKKLLFQDNKTQEIIFVKFKNNCSIAQLLKMPNGKTALLQTVKKYQDKGYKLLNTNLKDLSL